ncbi:MAG: hypothetical protein RDU13_06990 [Elusimicrobiales bacterium]|nr:hypothetical protein [Elusimicrobiales bacterium]
MERDFGYSLLLWIFAFLGLGMFFAAILKPRRLWGLVLFSAVLGTGLYIDGYGLIDEAFLFLVLVGYVIAARGGAKSHAIRVGAKSPFAGRHFGVFFMFMVYLVFQSLRGLLVLEDVRMLRFVAFFFLLAGLAYIFARNQSVFPPPHKTRAVLIYGALLHFALYLGYGYYVENFRGLDRFFVQGDEWAGSTVSMFPLFCIAGAVFLSLRKSAGKAAAAVRPRAVGVWVLLIVAMATSFYYDSRISWIFITGFLVLSAKDIGLLKVLKISSIFVAFLLTLSVWFLPGEGIIEQLSAFYRALFVAGTGMQESDVGRKLEIVSAFRMILQDPVSFFIGTGFYTERHALAPHFVDVLSQHGVYTDVSDLIRPATFSAFLAGTGMVGISFLLLCFVFTALEIIYHARGGNLPARKILLFSLCGILGSTIVSINIDLVLFYLAIMPSGLLVQLSRQDAVV